MFRNPNNMNCQGPVDYLSADYGDDGADDTNGADDRLAGEVSFIETRSALDKQISEPTEGGLSPSTARGYAPNAVNPLIAE